MLKNPITIGSFYNGLSALGKLEQNKFQTLENVDIHDEIGMAKPQLAMESESTTPNEYCFSAIDQDGNIYACSNTSGKIWKRTTAGVWSLVHTNANTYHTGCRYFNGYLWYWTSTKLGNFDLSSTWVDSFATGTGFREGIEANNTLLISNGRYLARIDAANTFSANEFVVPAQYKTTCLKNIGDDILVGTQISLSVASCKFFLWDTVSASWTYEDEVFEIGANCFVQLDNIYLAQCGTSGRFYYWTGSQMAYFGRIEGITTGIGEQNSVVFNGRPLFANANKIYSIHKEANGLSYAFCGEYTCTGTISSLAIQGQTLLASVGTGFDKRGTGYATATIETAEIQAKISAVKVSYDTYPDGITVSTNVNGAGYVEQTPIIETTEKEVIFNGGIADGATCQVKITLTDTAKIKKITLS